MDRLGVRGDGRELVRSWATDLDEATLRQAFVSARCAAVSGPVALMPDAHLGVGATVGSVIATDGAIIPAAVGVDIGCGMIAVRTAMTARDLPDSLDATLRAIEEAIPAGWASRRSSLSAAEAWMARDPVPHVDLVDDKVLRKAPLQLGTLGGGNHFVEVSLDERDRVWCVLHSGSRGIGNRLATRHIGDARSVCRDERRALEDPDLAYFLAADPQFGRYVDHMLWAQRYAFANREIMMDALLGAVAATFKRRPGERERINCHHNYATMEGDAGSSRWVTRKGAIRAGVGDRGIIPGSMGADTYIVTGLGNPDSYESASHGAGRRMSRSRAKRELSVDEFRSAMGGRAWQASKADRLVDESPMAYKDIVSVMADQADLVSVDHVLDAVLNYKGC